MSDSSSRSARSESASVAAVPDTPRVGWLFITLYTGALMGTSLLFLAPLLVTLALKVNALVGAERAPSNLALIAGVGSLVAVFGNPMVGRMSDRTSSAWGMRRPWMVVGVVGGCLSILVVALAPTIWVMLLGWCLAQLFFNAVLAVLVAVLPDQVPIAQRGAVAGILGVALPLASVAGTFVVQLFAGSPLMMFLGPCAIGGLLVLVFAARLRDRRLAVADKAVWSARELIGTFYVNPRQNPDFAWAFVSRFLFVMAYAFLATFQAYYLLEKIGSDASEVPRQIFLGSAVQCVFLVAASVIGGRLSDRIGRRKIFVLAASSAYALSMLVIALADDFRGFLVGMVIGGLGFGTYVAVDLALVVDVLPDADNAAKDLGVFNFAGAVPFSVAPAMAPMILAAGGGYSGLYAVAAVFALLGAVAILPVARVR